MPLLPVALARLPVSLTRLSRRLGEWLSPSDNPVHSVNRDAQANQRFDWHAFRDWPRAVGGESRDIDVVGSLRGSGDPTSLDVPLEVGTENRLHADSVPVHFDRPFRSRMFRIRDPGRLGDLESIGVVCFPLNGALPVFFPYPESSRRCLAIPITSFKRGMGGTEVPPIRAIP